MLQYLIPATGETFPLSTFPQAETYWYLATPYSKHPEGIRGAFIEACHAAADLLKAGHKVYSPIAHTHPIALYGEIDPLDHSIWLAADRPHMEAASGILVLVTDGWEDSRGVQYERGVFATAGKPELFVSFQEGG